MDRRLSVLDWLSLAIAVDLAVLQFLPVWHDLDPVGHSEPLVHWYGFPLVWLAGPGPASLFSQPIRNLAILPLVIDLACLVVAPLAVRHSATWILRTDKVTLGFNLRGLLGGVCCYSMMCAVWLNPRWSFLCGTWSCRFVINRGLLGSAIYLPLVLPAILFSSIALAVLVELSLKSGWNAWHHRRRPRIRPDAATLFPDAASSGARCD